MKKKKSGKGYANRARRPIRDRNFAARKPVNAFLFNDPADLFPPSLTRSTRIIDERT